VLRCKCQEEDMNDFIHFSAPHLPPHPIVSSLL